MDNCNFTLYYQHYYYSPAFKQIALQKLKKLHGNYRQNNNDVQLVVELSILLRRVALAKFPHHQVAGLVGIKWLQFLDKTGNTQEFTNGVGKFLCTAPYQQLPLIEIEILFDLVTLWIKQQ